MKKLGLILLAASSSAQAITPQQVVKAWQAAGLEVGKTMPMSRKDYGFAPFVGKGTRFLIPSLGTNNGGRIFDVSNASERQGLANYYIDLGKQSAMLYSHVFTYKNIVVQINGELDDAKAKKYQAALLKLH